MRGRARVVLDFPNRKCLAFDGTHFINESLCNRVEIAGKLLCLINC